MKAIKEVFQSDPCRHVPPETEREVIYFLIDLVGLSGAFAENGSCLGHLTLEQQMGTPPALCSRVLQVVSSSLNKDVDEMVPHGCCWFVNSPSSRCFCRTVFITCV